MALRRTVGNGKPKLFHYTSRETALEYILATGRLRLGRLPRTNDPREFEPLRFSVADDIPDSPMTSEDFLTLIQDADAALRGSVHLACLTQAAPDPYTSYPAYGDGPTRARMWAQYAGNHTGICLCFDMDRLLVTAADTFETDRECRLHHGPVRYIRDARYPATANALELSRSEAESDLAGYIERLLDAHVGPYFFTKSWDWETETEYRLLVRGDTADAEFIDIREALEAVVLGPRLSAVYDPTVAKLCEVLDVDAHRLAWMNGLPILLPGPWPPMPNQEQQPPTNGDS
jgi:hypothetical protein